MPPSTRGRPLRGGTGRPQARRPPPADGNPRSHGPDESEPAPELGGEMRINGGRAPGRADGLSRLAKMRVTSANRLRPLPLRHSFTAMQVELRHLRVLTQLAEMGSITRAAASLGVSQPTLSNQLRRIEKAFGGPLFVRGAGGITPTPLGRHVLARARGLLADMDDLLATLPGGGSRSGIRLGTHPHILLGEWLRSLETGLPHREVTTSLDYSGAVLTQLLANDLVDVVFMGRVADHHAPPCPPGTTERVITVEPCGIALASSHRLARRGRVSMTDLAEETWIPPQGGDDGGTAMLRAACEAAGFTPRFRYADTDFTSMVGFVAAGFAITLASPTWLPGDGITIVALEGHATDAYRVLRWRTSNVPTSEIDILHRTYHELYRPVVQRNGMTLPWLADNPDSRPRLLEVPCD
ncbi:LysR family transcriptional regulator [Actinomadura syzygii]|uniref:LysR family transcriptional regulator n=2 Tax=Actinomadura syzygii TaxID=1427538 RepID=A0A5D0ULY9_9ACTN|nr:LysR family transcriptional regulator [Actinomadura syzygii]